MTWTRNQKYKLAAEINQLLRSTKSLRRTHIRDINNLNNSNNLNNREPIDLTKRLSEMEERLAELDELILGKKFQQINASIHTS